MKFNLRDFMAGFVLGGMIMSGITMFANAYDPCDKSPNYQQQPYRYDYKKDEDAAMQFHWQDHQPSLHPR